MRYYQCLVLSMKKNETGSSRRGGRGCVEGNFKGANGEGTMGNGVPRGCKDGTRRNRVHGMIVSLNESN